MLTNKLWKMKNKIKIKGNSGLKLKQVHNTELYGLLIENWKFYINIYTIQFFKGLSFAKIKEWFLDQFYFFSSGLKNIIEKVKKHIFLKYISLKHPTFFPE